MYVYARYTYKINILIRIGITILLVIAQKSLSQLTN